METSNDGPLPQFELGPHLGGLKVLYQRAGSLVFQPVTMVSAMTGAWATSPMVQRLFLDSLLVYFGSVVLLGGVVMTTYYMFILPSEQSFNQVQSQRPERSPLKQDTETILGEIKELEGRLEKHGLEIEVHPDGGKTDDCS